MHSAPQRRARSRSARASLLLLASALVVASCTESGADSPVAVDPDTVQPLSPTVLETPAAIDSLAPDLAMTPAGPVLSWLERDRSQTPPEVSLGVARLEGSHFAPPATIAKGNDFFANWADFPAVATMPDGGLIAHWLRKIDSGTYAYGAALAHSPDGGKWSKWGWLHRDFSSTEHGFVSFVSDGEAVWAFWLDGRAMARGGAMSLRARRIVSQASLAQDGELLDDRVCECCQTDAALAAGGPIVVYRDRSKKEVRDIWRVLWQGDTWSEPAAVARDGWTIAGCPVNGPAVAAEGHRVAVAWFTAADAQPRVKLALSDNGGVSFGKPLLIDERNPSGRVDVALRGDRIWISWLGKGRDGAAVLLRRLDLEGRSASPGAVREVVGTSVERSSGFPRLLLDGERLLLAWVESGELTQVRVGSLALTNGPGRSPTSPGPTPPGRAGGADAPTTGTGHS